MKLAFIGAGHMGGACASGFASFGGFSPTDIIVTARHEASLEKFRAKGLKATTDNCSAVKDADIVFYAVKPWLMEEVVLQTVPYLDLRRQIIVSIAPGVSAASLRSWLGVDEGSGARIAYVIPNTAAEIGESMTYIAPVTASEADLEVLKSLFSKLGKAQVVPLSLMLAGTSLASCGIAYAMRYISASMEGGEGLGLPASEVGEAVCQTVRGAAALVAANAYKAEEEIDKVTTPGGLTLRGLSAMERGGFSSAVAAGLNAVSVGKHRIVVKVGSNVLTRDDGALDTTRVSSLVDQIVTLKRGGCEVILVTSGAVACGRSLMPQNRKLNDVQQRQLYSAIGQVRLMDMYSTLFNDYGVTVGQILTMKKNFSTPEEYENQRNCMDVMLQSGVLPIVNENDTVSTTELMFTDNDELSGLVASMMKADTLVLLSNVDGLLSDIGGSGGEVVPVVRPGESVEGLIGAAKSSSGRGGMSSKCAIASKAASEGIRVMIANGNRDGILVGLVNDPGNTVHTEFVPVS